MSKNHSLYLLILLSGIIFIIFYNKNNKSNNSYLDKEITENNFEVTGKAQIIDGDSILINQYEIRLYDIDAPEYKQNCKDKNKKKYKCGIKSMLHLKK